MKSEPGKKREGRIRKTAEERREEILEAAIAEFAARGLQGASVEQMAERVGVSQPYVYRLFGTKKDLFLAASERVSDRILETFRTAAEGLGSGDNVLEAMGRSYNSSLYRREEMLMVLQGFAAADDPEVREKVGRRFAELWRYVERTTGASEQEVWNFFGSGMLLTIDAAIGLTSRLEKEEWPQEYARPGA